MAGTWAVRARQRLVQRARRAGRACVRLGWLAWLLTAAPLHALTLRVGYYDNPPKVMRASDGSASGSLVELLQAIAAEEGWSLQFVACEWEWCLQQLQAGALDLMPDVAATPERQARFDFHQQPALLSWSQIYSRPSVRVTTLLDLDGRRVAVLQGSVQQQVLQSMVEGFDLRTEWVPVASFAAAFEAVAQGRADAAATNVHFGDYHMRAYGLVSTPIVFNPARLYYAVPKGRHTDVLRAIDRHLQRWSADPASPYHQIMRRWAMPQGVVRWPAWVLPAVGGLLAAALALGLATLWLRRQVRAATAELRRSERRYRQITESVADVIWTLDPRTQRFTYVSPAVQRLRGYTPEEVMAQPLDAVLLPDDARRVRERLVERLAALDAGTLDTGVVEVLELPQRRKDGSLVWTEVVTRLVREPDSGRWEVLGVTRDISERRAAQQRIEQLARFDQLTGLPNRTQLYTVLQRLLEEARADAKPLAVLVLDLDHFKAVNESQGLSVGDAVLAEVARRLTQQLRVGDVAARTGGDEFVVVLPGADAAQAAQWARTMLSVLGQPHRLPDGELALGGSVGVALFPDDGQEVDALLRRADAAMHEAKAAGRNTVRFYAAAQQQRAERLLRLSTALGMALTRGELYLQYQPQVDLRDGRIVGAEALLRWRHPEWGEVSPAEFIPVAEDTGRIVEIGDWVLREALAAARRWSDLPDAPYVAVNVSVLQVRQPGFAERLQALVQSLALPPQRVELEVTESVAAGHADVVRRTLQPLVQAGFPIAIDDFGTGYSSLAYLRRLGFRRLKIDRAFVQDIGRDADDEAIIRAIVQLARTLGLSTVAEGVETVQQAQFLAAVGCDVMQGWLFSAALAEADFAELCRHHDAPGWRQRWLAGQAG
ncbi:EAL domain-containing protein [Tepidimonas ignava]|uniref:EAL domain-containing protein n=1 Tax=Tepidimonas ignava TaxID=114249 RepID=UPI00104A3B84|nr:EAL domain-containing protein [Tepidimonas ignava]